MRLIGKAAVLPAAVFLAAVLASASFAGTVPTDRPVSLEECIGIALKGHPRIKGAEQNYEAGRFRTIQAAAPFLPVATFDASRSHSYSEQAVKTGSGMITTRSSVNLTSWGFNANWTLFDFGRTYYGVKSSRSLEDSLKDDLGTTEQGVAYDVMDAYFGLLKSQTLVKVAEETLDDAKGHLQQAQAFFDVGVKPKFDVTKAEVEVNDAKLQVIQADDAVKASRITLNTKLGVDPLAQTTVEERPSLEELKKPVEGYMEDALKARPDLKGLEAKLAASGYSVSAAKSGFLPTVSAGFTYGWDKEGRMDTVSNHSASVSLDVPLFEGFRNVGRLGEARANALSAKYAVEDARQNVLNDVSQAYLALQDAKARYETLESSVKEARENLDIAQGRYEAGVGALIDVTDARVSLTKAETDRAQAFYDYHLGYSKLLRSTGAPVK